MVINNPALTYAVTDPSGVFTIFNSGLELGVFGGLDTDLASTMFRCVPNPFNRALSPDTTTSNVGAVIAPVNKLKLLISRFLF